MQAVRSVQRDVMMMGIVLVTLASACAVVGAMGVANCLSGNTLRAAISLLIPAFLGYWAWQARDNLRTEPLIPIFSLVWLAGLPIGLVVHWLRQSIS
jgi:hypothetical protein